jgi:hypothetical protein
MGGELPPRGGIPRPPHQEPQRWQRSWHPWWARKRPPPDLPWKRQRRESASARRGSVWECCCGSDGRHSSVRRTLEEEEARLLHLEVSSVLPRHPQFRGAGV